MPQCPSPLPFHAPPGTQRPRPGPPRPHFNASAVYTFWGCPQQQPDRILSKVTSLVTSARRAAAAATVWTSSPSLLSAPVTSLPMSCPPTQPHNLTGPDDDTPDANVPPPHALPPFSHAEKWRQAGTVTGASLTSMLLFVFIYPLICSLIHRRASNLLIL